MTASEYCFLIASFCLLLAWALHSKRQEDRHLDTLAILAAYRHRPRDPMRGLRSDGRPSGTHAR